MGAFEVKECNDTEVAKALFIEYSQIKGAEGCFVSFDKELADLNNFYKGGAILVGYENDNYLITWQKSVDDENWEDLDAHEENMDVEITEESCALYWRVKVDIIESEIPLETKES